MAFLNCEVFSKTMNMATTLRVILPDEGNLGDAVTVYLLHGLSDNSSGWTRYTAVEQFARERVIYSVLSIYSKSRFMISEKVCTPTGYNLRAAIS